MAISQIVTNSIATGAVVADDLANGSVTAAKLASAQTLSVNGITFPATQVPSANANTLDDYEEGTFNVSIGGSPGGVTYNARSGSYVKTGSIVHFAFQLDWSGYSAASASTVTGLPFAPASANFWMSVTPYVNFGLNLPSGKTYLNGYVASGGDPQVVFTGQGNNGGSSPAAPLSAAGNIYITGYYQVN